MLEKLFHLLTGYAEFEVLGDSARFFNIAAKSGYGFWGFSRRNGKAVARVKAREYKRLRAIRRRCHVRLHITRKRGLPFQSERLRRRKGLLVGAAAGIALYAFLGSFLWGVSVTGADLLTDREILQAAREYGVYEGASRTGFSPKEAAHGITGAVKGLTWVSVNTDGCFAQVAVKESAEKPNITDDKKWSNLVASREGTVVKIEAERGRPEVKLGDTVKKGDLLVAGLYQDIVDPYGVQPESPMVTMGAARGSVIAETYREFTVQVSAVKKESVPNGKKKVNSAFSVFGLRIPLGFNTVPVEECRFYTETTRLTALDVALPVYWEQDVYEFLGENRRTLTEEEMKEAALLKLREAQKTTIPRGGRIVKEELSYSFTDGLCILNAQCRCEEEIGEVRNILLN